MGNGVIGPKLADEQRWALVEYLKSIPEEAGPCHALRRPTECCHRKPAVGESAASRASMSELCNAAASGVEPRFEIKKRRGTGVELSPL